MLGRGKVQLELADSPLSSCVTAAIAFGPRSLFRISRRGETDARACVLAILHPYNGISPIEEKARILDKFIRTIALYCSGDVFGGRIPLVWYL